MEKSLFEKLILDPRYKTAKKELLQLLSEYQKQLTCPRKANPGLEAGYQQLLRKAASLRGTPLFHPYLGSGLGNGLLVELADGSVKYDLICGIGVHYFGHSFPELISYALDASLENTIMQGNLQQNVDSIELLEHLTKYSKFDHAFLTTSGAMANENALKIIFQKKHPAFRLIAFEGCFMGRTCVMSQLTDKPAFREGLPANIFIDYIPFYNPNDPKKSTEETLAVLKKHLKRHPQEYAALCLELVQGENGFYAGTKEFFLEIIKVAKEANLAILVDEVQTFARTYELFAFQHFGLQEVADVVTVGKVLQCGATLWKDAYNPKPGLLSQTFTASSSSIWAAKFLLPYIMEQNYFGENGKIAALFSRFSERLSALKGIVKGPFGLGSMIAFTPFDGSPQKVNQFIHKLFDNGVISFVAGTDPTRVRFLLPVGIMDEKDVDPIMDIVEKTLNEMKTL